MPQMTLIHLAQLNQIRNAHPAVRQLRNIEFHHTDDTAILAFSKYLSAENSPSGKSDAILVVANVDPHAVRETTVHLDLAKIGLDSDSKFEVTDLITNQTYVWSANNFVRLDAFTEPVHVFKIGKQVK